MAAGTKMVHKMQASSSTATARPGPHHADCLLTGEDEGGGDAGHDRGRGDDDPAAWSPPGGVPARGPFRAAQETRNPSSSPDSPNRAAPIPTHTQPPPSP